MPTSIYGMFHSSGSVSCVDTCETRPESYFLINQGQQLCRSICLSKYQVAQVNMHTSIHKKIHGSSRARCVWHTVWATDERTDEQADRQGQIYMPPHPLYKVVGIKSWLCVWKLCKLEVLTAPCPDRSSWTPRTESETWPHHSSSPCNTCDIIIIQSHLPHTSTEKQTRYIQNIILLLLKIFFFSFLIS